MGKSYKKPIITDSSKSAKKMSHQKFRKKVKQKIQEQRFDEIPEDEREVTNSYDVCDWVCHVDKDSDYYEKAKRK